MSLRMENQVEKSYVRNNTNVVSPTVVDFVESISNVISGNAALDQDQQETLMVIEAYLRSVVRDEYDQLTADDGK